ncbi:MAG: hypothetical protein Q8K75_12950 [Chlamydiales bacterium]|nr:hypothetical protein [Chlamydiales bacterium]
MLTNYSPVTMGEAFNSTYWPLVGCRLIDEVRYFAITRPDHVISKFLPSISELLRSPEKLHEFVTTDLSKLAAFLEVNAAAFSALSFVKAFERNEVQNSKPDELFFMIKPMLTFTAISYLLMFHQMLPQAVDNHNNRFVVMALSMLRTLVGRNPTGLQTLS